MTYTRTWMPYKRNGINSLALAASQNENSTHWHEKAMKMANELADAIGYEAYCEWIDAQPEMLTWKQLYNLIMARQAQADDCNCVTDDQSCPACRTKATTVYSLAEQF